MKSFKISNWVFIKVNFGRLIKQIHSEWLDLKNDLFPVGLVQIPRHVIVAQSEIIEIHQIADASEKAYACCVYIRSVSLLDKKIESRLLCAKSRVIHLKSLTLSTLQFSGALLFANTF